MTDTGFNVTFPALSASNLEGVRYELPGDFEGELNLLIIAFQRRHQEDVNTWLPFVRELRGHLPILHYYELPVISRGNPVFRLWLDNAMKAGIPGKESRSSTITLHVDKPAFRAALDITDEDDICVILTDKLGHVLWRTQGPMDDAKRMALARLLQTGRI
ncbi:MAG: hypothetical protein WCK47_14240 [bacterium]|nr:hypothetical protein [Candidatus Sumerlaeota bacterium]